MNEKPKKERLNEILTKIMEAESNECNFAIIYGLLLKEIKILNQQKDNSSTYYTNLIQTRDKEAWFYMTAKINDEEQAQLKYNNFLSHFHTDISKEIFFIQS